MLNVLSAKSVFRITRSNIFRFVEKKKLAWLDQLPPNYSFQNKEKTSLE